MKWHLAYQYSRCTSWFQLIRRSQRSQLEFVLWWCAWLPCSLFPTMLSQWALTGDFCWCGLLKSPWLTCPFITSLATGKKCIVCGDAQAGAHSNQSFHINFTSGPFLISFQWIYWTPNVNSKRIPCVGRFRLLHYLCKRVSCVGPTRPLHYLYKRASRVDPIRLLHYLRNWKVKQWCNRQRYFMVRNSRKRK